MYLTHVLIDLLDVADMHVWSPPAYTWWCSD